MALQPIQVPANPEDLLALIPQEIPPAVDPTRRLYASTGDSTPADTLFLTPAGEADRISLFNHDGSVAIQMPIPPGCLKDPASGKLYPSPAALRRKGYSISADMEAPEGCTAWYRPESHGVISYVAAHGGGSFAGAETHDNTPKALVSESDGSVALLDARTEFIVRYRYRATPGGRLIGDYRAMPRYQAESAACALRDPEVYGNATELQAVLNHIADIRGLAAALSLEWSESVETTISTILTTPEAGHENLEDDNAFEEELDDGEEPDLEEGFEP